MTLMKTSPEGIELIKKFEGLELESYQDIAGIWTIGYGQTGNGIGPDQRITTKGAEELLIKALAPREEVVNRLVNVPLNQGQFDALVSLIYNIGEGRFEKSTCLRRLNRGDYAGAAQALTWFNKATIDGQLQVVRGLSRRRTAEKALFLAGVHTLPIYSDPGFEDQIDIKRVRPQTIEIVENIARLHRLGQILLMLTGFLIGR